MPTESLRICRHLFWRDNGLEDHPPAYFFKAAMLSSSVLIFD